MASVTLATNMVGGAPVNETFAKSIGANIYTSDGAPAADAALAVIMNSDR